MTQLLNTHPNVCIGFERFKYFNRRYAPRLFEEERFFTFNALETNARPETSEYWAELYRALREKWPNSTVRGDKLGTRRMEGIMQAFPEAPIIYMLRDIDSVAASWNGRARRLTGTGKWPLKNDFTAAVARWNVSNALALRATASPGSGLLVVQYDHFFASGRDVAERLAALIGVEAAPEFLAAHETFSSHYREVVLPKRRKARPGQAEFIRENADMETYEALLELGRRQFAA